MMDDINSYVVKLDDGRDATCVRGDRVDYANGAFEAGVVKNMPPETHYLRIESGDDLQILFLKRNLRYTISYEFDKFFF